jgi:hypothetical protein
MVTQGTEAVQLGLGTGMPVESAMAEKAVEPLIVPFLDGEGPVEAGTTPQPIEQEPAPLTRPAPLLTPEVQQRLARADRLEEQEQQKAEHQAVTEALQGFVDEAGRRGMVQEDIDWFSQTQTTTVRQLLGNFQRSMEEREFYWGRRLAAYDIGREKGVDPNLLMDARDPDHMRQMADRELRYTNHEGRISATEQSRVPAQSLNRTNASRAGGQAVTSDNIDLLHREGLVSDDTYRRFLSTGQIR